MLADPRWHTLRARLTPVEHLTGSADGYHQQAAVLLPILNLPVPELVLTRRALHLSSHAGEIAFPGGRWEPVDRNLLDTALRESHEEIALPPHEVIPLGALPVCCTRAGVRVTPVVGLVPKQQAFVPQLTELDSIFSVPVRFFSANNASHSDILVRDGQRLEMPAFAYDGYHIWGLTAVLAHMLAQHCQLSGL